MLTKLTNLHFNPGERSFPVYILVGTEVFLLNHCAQQIKTHWQTIHNEPCDSKVLQIQNTTDWINLDEELSSYSLFAETTIIDARYEKKSLDVTGKSFLNKYLNSPNMRSLLLLRAPLLTAKTLQFVANQQQVHIIVCAPLSASACKQWLAGQLKQLGCQYTDDLPALIYQYNENNLLACSQVLEKISLLAGPDKKLSITDIEEHLSNQCTYPVFELADSCLQANKVKALLLIRQCSQNKTEPTLVLWLITQEIRILLRLLEEKQQGLSFKDCAAKLKIWTSRVSLYQAAFTRFTLLFLGDLLKQCERLDRAIKTEQNNQVWRNLELLALALCTGQKVGHFE